MPHALAALATSEELAVPTSHAAQSLALADPTTVP
jgi:hypothetical protein